MLASGSWGDSVRLWNAATGAHLRQLLDDESHKVKCVEFSPDGNILACGVH